MKASAKATLAIAADPEHLGARIGIIAVLHTWGSAMTHHPHVHMIVPGGGLSEDGSRWISSRPRFLVHVNVLSRLFQGRFLAMLVKAHTQSRLRFFGDHAALADRRAFKRFLAPLRKIECLPPASTALLRKRLSPSLPAVFDGLGHAGMCPRWRRWTQVARGGLGRSGLKR